MEVIYEGRGVIKRRSSLELGEKLFRSSRKDRVVGIVGFLFFKWRRMLEKNVGVRVV